MNKTKILLILMMVLLITPILASATIQNNYTMDVSKDWILQCGTGKTDARGLKFVPAFNVTIVNATFKTSGTANIWYLLNSTKGLITSGAMTGDVANVNYNITKGLSYYLVANKTSGTYTGCDNVTSPAFPYVKTRLNYTATLQAGSDVTDSVQILHDITTNMPYDDGTTIYDTITFQNQTPSDLSTTNVIGTRLNITYNVTIANTTYFNQSSIKLNYSTPFGSYLNGTLLTNSFYELYTDINVINVSYSWLLNDNQVYPGSYNYNETLMESTTHLVQSESNTNHLWSIELLNVNSSRAYSFFELMINNTGNADIFYCNSSYSTGNPSVNNNCILISTFSSTGFNHTHNFAYNYSRHNYFTLPINTTSGKVGTISVTSTSYFLVRETSGLMNLGYIMNSSRNNAFKYSTNLGASWTSNDTISLDAHIHQFNGGATDNFTYNACYSNITNLLCTTLRPDSYDLTPLPPTSPIINKPIADNRYGINTSLQTNFTASTPYYSGVTITSYNITLLNSDFTYNKTLNNTATLTNFNYTILNVTEGRYAVKVTAKDSNNLTSFSVSELFNVTSTLNVVAKDIFNNATISNFTGWAYNYDSEENITIVSVIANGTFILPNGTYKVHLDVPGNYSTGSSDFNISVSNNYTNVVLYLYKWNSLYMRFIDQATNLLVNTTQVRIDLISDILAVNYTTNNGTIYVTLLDPANYVARYYATGYATRLYNFLINNNSNATLNLYMINSSVIANVTITIVDESDTRLEGAVVKVLRYDISSNTFNLVEIGNTNYNGDTIVSLTLGDEYYKFMIEYPSGTLRLTTSPAYITTNSITIPISLAGNPAQDYFDYLTLNYDLSFNTLTNTFRLNFNDVDNIANDVCLYIYSVNYLGKTLVNDSCSSSASGTILLGVNNVSGAYYVAEAYWTNSADTELFLTALNYQFNVPAPSSKTGLLLQVILSLTMTILTINSGLAPVVLPISLLLGGFIGLHSLPLTITIIMVVVGLIITIILAKPRG